MGSLSHSLSRSLSLGHFPIHTYTHLLHIYLDALSVCKSWSARLAFTSLNILSSSKTPTVGISRRHIQTVHTQITTATTHCHSQWPTRKLWVCVCVREGCLYVWRGSYWLRLSSCCPHVEWCTLCVWGTVRMHVLHVSHYLCMSSCIFVYIWECKRVCVYACVVAVCLPGGGDGKHWLYRNARVVRKPAGSLVLAAAGGGTSITITPAPVSKKLRNMPAWTKGCL